MIAALPKWGILQYHRMLVRLPDEGIIGLDWYKWQECKRLPSTAPVLLVLHGITGVLKCPPRSVCTTRRIKAPRGMQQTCKAVRAPRTEKKLP